MSKNVRLVIVLSAIWVAAVLAYLAWEYFNISPRQCIFTLGKFSEETGFGGPVKRFFISCNVFSDIPTQWWGTATFRHGKQVIELSTFRLVFTTAPPIAAIWFVFAVCPALWRWVASGRSATR